MKAEEPVSIRNLIITTLIIITAFALMIWIEKQCGTRPLPYDQFLNMKP